MMKIKNKYNLIILIYLFCLICNSIFYKNLANTPSIRPCEEFENAQTQTDLNISSGECYEEKHDEYINYINRIDYSQINQKNKKEISELIKTYDSRRDKLIKKNFPHQDIPMYYGSSFSMRYNLLLIDFDEQEVNKIKKLIINNLEENIND